MSKHLHENDPNPEHKNASDSTQSDNDAAKQFAETRGLDPSREQYPPEVEARFKALEDQLQNIITRNHLLTKDR